MFASHSSSGGTSESCSNRACVRFLFLSGTRSILQPCLNMRTYFIVLRKGIFLKPCWGAHTKRKIKHGKERNLLWMRVGPWTPRLNPAQQSSRCSRASRHIKRAVIEFWSVFLRTNYPRRPCSEYPERIRSADKRRACVGSNGEPEAGVAEDGQHEENQLNGDSESDVELDHTHGAPAKMNGFGNFAQIIFH